MKCEQVIRECSYQDNKFWGDIDAKTLNVALLVAKDIDCHYDLDLQDNDWICDSIVNSKSFDIVSLVSKRTFVCRVQDESQWKKVFKIFEHYCYDKLTGNHLLYFEKLNDIVSEFFEKQ